MVSCGRRRIWDKKIVFAKVAMVNATTIPEINGVLYKKMSYKN